MTPPSGSSNSIVIPFSRKKAIETPSSSFAVGSDEGLIARIECTAMPMWWNAASRPKNEHSNTAVSLAV